MDSQKVSLITSPIWANSTCSILSSLSAMFTQASLHSGSMTQGLHSTIAIRTSLCMSDFIDIILDPNLNYYFISIIIFKENEGSILVNCGMLSYSSTSLRVRGSSRGEAVQSL